MRKKKIDSKTMIYVTYIYRNDRYRFTFFSSRVRRLDRISRLLVHGGTVEVIMLYYYNIIVIVCKYIFYPLAVRFVYTAPNIGCADDVSRIIICTQYNDHVMILWKRCVAIGRKYHNSAALIVILYHYQLNLIYI